MPLICYVFEVEIYVRKMACKKTICYNISCVHFREEERNFYFCIFTGSLGLAETFNLCYVKVFIVQIEKRQNFCMENKDFTQNIAFGILFSKSN